MDLIRSLAIAFSMYSRVPVPQVEWSERSMKYTFLFFPAVGLLEGALLLGIGRLLRLGGIAPLLRGAFLTLFLFLYTGGIHMDGFMDTMDALGSARPREEKLRILKDPHTGSFAVLSCVLCCILVFTSFAGLDSEAALRVPACGMVLSRALSALFLITVPGKTRKGSAKMFADAASRMVTIIALFFWGAAAAVCILLFGGVTEGAAVLAAAGIVSLWYVVTATREFGGLTGDTAGWFLTILEAVILCISCIFSGVNL